MLKLKEFINSKKHQEQLTKLLYTIISCLILLVVVELIFQIPAIEQTFSTETLSTYDDSIIWIVLWLLMFAQVTILPIPALPIQVFCNNTALVAAGTGLVDLFSSQTLFFVFFTTSASFAGSVCAYLLGRIAGQKAIRWVAGDIDEYNLWCNKLNGRAGKWLYAVTVLLPFFPDDLICIAVGALKLNFGFYTIANIFGRVVGCYTLLIFMRLPYISDIFTSSASGGFPVALLVYSILTVLTVVLLIVWKSFLRKKS